MPIEELSRRTGVTVRNLRELQTRGLLEPPLLEGRKGRYTERHVARVKLVRSLQDRGYSIASIADLLARWTGSLGPLGVMNVEDGIATPGVREQRQLSEHELFEMFPELGSSSGLLEHACEVGLVCKAAGGEIYAPSAELLETAHALLGLGIPLDVQLRDFRLLKQEIDVMTARFRDRFQEYVVSRLQERGMPAADMEELASRLASVRPAVVRGVAIVLSTALDRGGAIAAIEPAAPETARLARQVKVKAPSKKPGTRRRARS
jgi:DNA-binding transcriptional MerR regulator